MKTIDLAQAAALLHLHPETVLQRARDGKIPAAKPGKCWVFVDDDLLEWLRGQYFTGKEMPSAGKKGKKPCSENAAASGGLIFSKLDDDFESLVAQPTETRRRKSTTVSRLDSGSRPVSAKRRT